VEGPFKEGRQYWPVISSKKEKDRKLGMESVDIETEGMSRWGKTSLVNTLYMEWSKKKIKKPIRGTLLTTDRNTVKDTMRRKLIVEE